MPHWVKASLDAWTTAAGLTQGRAFRAINKAGRVWGEGMTAKVIWDVVKAAAKMILVPRPRSATIGGEPPRDTELLDWCGQVVTDVFGE